ncbi:MAG: hypothetical protein AAB546_01010 [Patescibacteria group bacterium]
MNRDRKIVAIFPEGGYLNHNGTAVVLTEDSLPMIIKGIIVSDNIIVDLVVSPAGDGESVEFLWAISARAYDDFKKWLTRFGSLTDTDIQNMSDEELTAFRDEFTRCTKGARLANGNE